jgi:hypothetical protein
MKKDGGLASQDITCKQASLIAFGMSYHPSIRLADSGKLPRAGEVHSHASSVHLLCSNTKLSQTFMSLFQST